MVSTNKFEIQELVIEVTRKCNMKCAHCLRGKAENLNIDYSYIDKLLENISYISEVTFTGGEPSMNVGAMEYFLKKVSEMDIPVSSFFIATNAKKITKRFIDFLSNMFMYCYENSGDEALEMSGIAPSVDQFHTKDTVIQDNINRLRMFSFFKDFKMNDHTILIDEGRAKNLSSYKKRELVPNNTVECSDISDGSISIDEMIYLSANGDIRTDCDTAYNDNRFTIGNLNHESFHDIIMKKANFS